jgi:Calponin homology (CH) domain
VGFTTNHSPSQAFTAWVNGVLERIGEHIQDITSDFSDGIRLAHFLELLSGKKLGKKLEEDRKADIYRIQNLYLALQFAESQMGVKAEGVAAEGTLFFTSFTLSNFGHSYISQAHTPFTSSHSIHKLHVVFFPTH